MEERVVAGLVELLPDEAGRLPRLLDVVLNRVLKSEVQFDI